MVVRLSGQVSSELVIRGQSHSIRFKLGPARDDGEHSYVRGRTAAVTSFSPSSLNWMLQLYELSPAAM